MELQLTIARLVQEFDCGEVNMPEKDVLWKEWLAVMQGAG